MLTRKPNWQSALHQFLLASLAKPFAYGGNDCCLFVADAVHAVTGTDLAAPFRGRYSSRKEALELAKSYAGRASVQMLVMKALHEAKLLEIAVSRAQRGDIVLVRRGGDDHSLGIIALTGKDIIAAAEEGFLRLHLNRAVRAWRV